MKNKYSNVPFADWRTQCSSDKRAMSLILTLLIISSIITATVLVGEIIIRHSQVVRGAEISEKAFFAAEAAMEKTCYQVFKNYDDVSSFSLSGVMSDGESGYSATVGVDVNCPDVSETECDYYCGTPSARCPVSPTNPWTITLSQGESFQLDIDLNQAAYPAEIQISRAGSSETDISVYECETGGTPRVCSSETSQSFSITFPYTFNISDYANNYYKLRIYNAGDASESYTLTPTGNLPLGIEISANGAYSGYKRNVKTNVPKWQKYGY